MTEQKKQTLHAMIHTAGLCFLLLVTLPATAYYFNQDSIVFNIANVLTLFLYVLIPTVLVSTLICLRCQRLWRYINSIILGSILYLFIRNFLFPVAFGALDGREIVVPSLLSDPTFWISLGIFVCGTTIAFFKKNTAEFFVILVLLFSLGFTFFVFFQQKPVVESTKQERTQLSRFSTTKNILVISLDGLQNNFFYDVLEKNPALKKVFDGFTFFTDVTSYGPITALSVTSTLSGNYLPTGQEGNSAQGLSKQYEKKSLLSRLANEGFKADGFGPFLVCEHPATCLSRNNVLTSNHLDAMIFDAYKTALLRVIPESISWPLVKRLPSFSLSSRKDTIMRMQTDKEGQGFGLDRYVFRQLYQQPTLTSDPVVKFHHYIFTHQPIRFDAKCHYHADMPQNTDTAKNEMLCVIHELDLFLKTLKQLNVYDNSTIILTSDHGYEVNLQQSDSIAAFMSPNPAWSVSRYWPILILKPEHSRGNLQFNDKPVELVDIAPTAYEAAQPISQDKSNHFDGISLLHDTAKIPEKRSRKIMLFAEYGSLANFYEKRENSAYYTTVTFEGNAREGIYNAMKRQSALHIKPVTCHQTLLFKDESLSDYFFLNGLSGTENWGRWSNGPQVDATFRLDESQCSQHHIRLKLSAYFDPTYLKQEAEVSLNGHSLGNIVLKKEESLPRDIVLDYDPNMLNINGLNTLIFNIAHPAKPQHDDRLLGLGFYEMTFE